MADGELHKLSFAAEIVALFMHSKMHPKTEWKTEEKIRITFNKSNEVKTRSNFISWDTVSNIAAIWLQSHLILSFDFYRCFYVY